jgi:hypothetical protein
MQNNVIQLIFVYNADSGLFNTVTDIAHKIFSPQTYSCGLCALTHSYFSMRDEWRSFIESLGVDCQFMHRDEFVKKYQNDNYEWPTILTKSAGQLKVCLGPADINTCDTLEELKILISEKCLARSD